MYDSARARMPGALISVRYRGVTFAGLRIPESKLEQVELQGAEVNVEGAIRVKASELPRVWPKFNEIIEIKSPESGKWEQRLVGPTKLDEMGATVLMAYMHYQDDTQ